MPADSYFICATPRTGSSLLLGLLESTGDCGHPQACFRSPDEHSWSKCWGLTANSYADFVEAARRAGTTPNGVWIHGCPKMVSKREHNQVLPAQ
jgi:trehalose 2-sulfotransferase